MTSRIKVDRLPPELKAEVQRLWDVYALDTGFMTFDEWVIATQTEPGRKAVSDAVESTLERKARIDRSIGHSVER